MSDYPPASEAVVSSHRDYRLIHDVYVVLDAIDRCVLAPLGLTNTQYRLLTLLRAEDGMRLTDLSDNMICNRSTITRLIDKLEAKGLVKRMLPTGDRRVQRVFLTPAGLELQERASAAHHRSLVERLQYLTPDEQTQLASLLEKMRVSLRTDLELREKNGERSVYLFDSDE